MVEAYKLRTGSMPQLREFRKYHRDEKGKIVKPNDHLMMLLDRRMDAGDFRSGDGACESRNYGRPGLLRTGLPLDSTANRCKP